MEKPSYKLVGAPCGQHGQYTFYKAIKLTGLLERIVAIGDFFFVKIWQDSELISIGELQLLWTDRVSDQTLVSLRLYFLPENTPDGRGQHGEHEVLAINDKVVLRAEDLLSWVCVGREWRWGLRAVWRGDCAPPAPPSPSLASPAAASAPPAPHTAPLHHTRLDFSDVEKEKSAITVDEEAPGVVVFSYPRYCRYRALVARLEGIQARWLRDSLVAALGGYAAPTKNTRILYCKDTFEYPELEGHEFVCNHLAPKLKGRPRGRRRRAADRSPGRSPGRSPARSDSRSSDSDGRHTPDNKTHRRLSLRNGPDKVRGLDKERGVDKERGSDDVTAENGEARPSPEDEAFMSQLIHFYRDKGDSLKIAHTLKHMSLRLIYLGVVSRGGYEAVCRDKLWRHLYADLGPRVRRLYERCLLPFENHERRLSKKYMKGLNGKVEKAEPIEVGDSPLRDDKRLRTPSPHLDNETGEVLKDDITVTSKPAEELNREFLDSLPEPDKPAKISVKPVEKLIEPGLKSDAFDADYKDKDDDKRDGYDAHKYIGNSEGGVGGAWRVPAARAPLADLGPLAAITDNHNGHAQKSRPAGRSSLRAVRVKPARPPPHPAPHPAPANTQPAPTSSGRQGPSPPNNFGIHHPPPPAPPAQPPAPAPPAPPHSDDDIVEVPYKPKSPEIIDLDEYPESPQAGKRRKLDILKERGLEVTAVPPAWGAVPLPGAVPLLPAPLLHPLLAPAQIYQMYNILPPSYPNGAPAPKVIQAVSAFGTAGPEKTVYGNPKDPFMPPPHVLGCAPLRPRPLSPPARDVLDLTCPPPERGALEIVRVPAAPSPAAPAPPAAQNLAKNYTLLDGKAVVGSNLEITLVDPKAQTPPKQRPPQKRNSNGKFAAKTPTPPREPRYPPASPSGKRAPPPPPRDESPTGSTGSRDSASSGFLNAYKAPGGAGVAAAGAGLALDPQLYVSSLYGGLGALGGAMGGLGGAMGGLDQRQLAMYREFVASQFRGYSGLLNIGPPTTKN